MYMNHCMYMYMNHYMYMYQVHVKEIFLLLPTIGPVRIHMRILHGVLALECC